MVDAAAGRARHLEKDVTFDYASTDLVDYVPTATTS